jgi:uncharacterized protein YkwD
MRAHLPRRLLAVTALLVAGAACTTKTTNNPPATTTSSTTTSSVGTRPGPAPDATTPAPADASSLQLNADDFSSRPPGGGPRLGATFPSVGSTSSSAAYFGEGPEQEFREYTNQDRAIVGAPLVARDTYLDSYARAQAQAMGEAGGIYHSNIGVLLCCYWSVGENVGYGGSARQIQYAYEASYGHFRNLTNETFSRMGIGVYIDNAGRMWTASTFAG